jgi:hypothetical protein
VDIIETIDSALSSTLTSLNIQSFYGWYDSNINETHVTFTLISDIDEDFSDNEAETNTQLVQVDIWSKENIESLKKTIKTAMKSIDDCTYSNGQDFYEAEDKIYHKALRFYVSVEA